MNLHDLIEDLTTYLKLDPEQQFRVTAKIKRLIHHEKEFVYMRYADYAESDVGKDKWIVRILKEACENHREWATRPDEEIVTWDVGTHKFKQGIEPSAINFQAGSTMEDK